MRVLVAPDKFAGTLTAVEAAEAIATGWRRRAPGDELDLAPMADGGPGFVDVLHAALGGELLAVTVRGPLGEPTPATVLLDGTTAYLEAAQACGLHLTRGRERAEGATTYGVGELLLAARNAPGRPRSWSGWAAAAPTTAGPGCSPPSGRPLTGRSTASTSSRRPTSTTRCRGSSARPRCSGRRRGSTADQVAEESASPAGRRSRRIPTCRAPARPAASASPCWRCRAAASRASTRSPTRSGSTARTGGRPRHHGGGCLRLLQPARQGAIRRRHPAQAPGGRAWCSPDGSTSAARDAGAGGRVGVLPRRPVGEERAFADPAGALADLAADVSRQWSRAECLLLWHHGIADRCARVGHKTAPNIGETSP